MRLRRPRATGIIALTPSFLRAARGVPRPERSPTEGHRSPRCRECRTLYQARPGEPSDGEGLCRACGDPRHRLALSA